MNYRNTFFGFGYEDTHTYYLNGYLIFKREHATLTSALWVPTFKK